MRRHVLPTDPSPTTTSLMAIGSYDMYKINNVSQILLIDINRYQAFFFVYSSMHNFRSLKNKLVNGKRQSQKIDQVEIQRLRANFHEDQCGLKSINGTLMLKLQKKMHKITEENYKIGQIVKKDCMSTSYRFIDEVFSESDFSSQKVQLVQEKTNYFDECAYTYDKKISQVSTMDDREQTKKFTFSDSQQLDRDISMNGIFHNQNEGQLQEESYLSRGRNITDSIETIKRQNCQVQTEQGYHEVYTVLELINHLNKLEQKKNSLSRNSDQKQKLKVELQQKMANIKQRILKIQHEYNTERNSISSQIISNDSSIENSQRNFVCETIRDQSEDLPENFQIKFRRINLNDYQAAKQSKISNKSDDQVEQYINETFNSQDYEEYKNMNSPSKILDESELAEIQNQNEAEIVHLFSYQKNKCEKSPLSKITQRSSEYMSPESHCQKLSKNSLQEQSLEYKKILYMLETTDRHKNHQKNTQKQKYLYKLSDLSDISAEKSSRFQNSREIKNKENLEDHQIKAINKQNSCKYTSNSSGFSQRGGKAQALKDIVNLLQTKYNRKLDLFKQDQLKKHLKTGLENKFIKLRNKK